MNGLNGTRLTVQANREVVLAAGALHTPQLLQLSGIGDRRHLDDVGVKTFIDLPGVGANYQDHLMFLTIQTGKSASV